LGHRTPRDVRITTHVGLVARAFGARKIYIPGGGKNIKKSIERVVERFGGAFEVDTEMKARAVIRKHKGVCLHLTMYGEKLHSSLDEITERSEGKDKLVIVGAEKVPRYIYDLADLNISVGNQPHSEIAALAIFMDRLTNGGWVELDFPGGMKVVPHRDRKIVVKKTL